jgi:3-hydroxyacyl-CoA dehydrogenase
VAASVTRKFEDGLKFERERFLHLMQTTESKALRHAFFAERVASKVPMCRPIRQCAASSRRP